MRGRKILCIALFCMMMLSLFIYYQEEVEALEIDYIKITDAPNGTELTTVNLFVSGQITVYASGYNATGPTYVDLVPVNWAQLPTLGNLNPINGTSTVFTAGSMPGTTTISGQNLSLGVSDDFTIQILPGTIDYIKLTDTQGGSELVNVTLPIGQNLTMYASGYNSSGPTFISLVEVDWSQIPVLGSLNPTIGTYTVFSPGITTGNTTITGENITLALADDCKVNIVENVTIDYIQIRDQAGGGGSVVGSGTYALWENDGFHAAGYNYSSGYRSDVMVTWTSNDTSVGTVTSPGFGTQFTAVGFGACFITADYGGGINNSTGILTVITIDEIIIRDEPGGMGSPILNRSFFVSENETFWAACYNDIYGYLGDYNVTWNSSNESVGSVSPFGSFTNFQAVGEGTCTITANFSGIVTNTTDTITVQTYGVDYIVILDSPNGTGNVVWNTVYKIGDGDIFWASGHNYTYGYCGDISVNWTSNDTGVGTVTTPGVSTTFNAVGLGSCTVEAEYGGITNTTGVLTVASVDYILIRDSSNNGGYEVGDDFHYIGLNWTYYAASYNNTHGYLGDVSVNWTSSDPGVGTVTTPGPSTHFGPIGDGNCVVTANFSGITDDTGILTVSSYDVDYVQIRDTPGGGGNVVVDPIYEKGSSDIYYGAMYSSIVGYLADAPYDSSWYSTHPSIVHVTSTGTHTTVSCNNTNSGTAIITLWAGGFTNKTNITMVTVLDWVIDYISIRDAPGGSGNVVNDRTYSVWDTDTYYVVACNYTQGYIMDVNASWSSDNVSVGTVTTPGETTTFTAQWVYIDSTCQVTAYWNTFGNITGILTVLAPRTDFVQIRDTPGGGGAVISSISYHKGDTDNYYGASYNSTVGFFAPVPAISSWISSNTNIVDVTSPGNSSTITCSIINSGTVTVTLNDTFGHTNSSTVTVLDWIVDYIRIRDAPLGGGNDLSDPANYTIFPVGYETEFYGAMYNYTAGYIADVASTSTWTSSESYVVDVSSPGVYSTITCSNTNYGTVTITLEEWMGYNATTQVTVLEPTIDSIKIMDAANGTGDEVEDMEYEMGEEDNFYAAAFNTTAGYLYDVSVDWSSNDTSVGTVTTPGTSTNFSAEGMGTCFVTATYTGGISDNTGTITVTLPSNLTVDDSGGALFTSIQEAINHSKDGDIVYVYSGVYYEHLTINKSITLMGENKETTIINWENEGKVIYVSGDTGNNNLSLIISGFTIKNGEYGIYCDESDSTIIIHNIIKDYDYGIYNYKTTNAYLAYNTITNGEYGIVTYEAYNDAIRWNEISYNTEYGAKDYNSQLKNCFNWNYFHHNNIAYYYDPDQPLQTMEFDGNILEDNYIGIKAENASTLSITNNSALRNEYGIYLINASPQIADNNLSGSKYGIYAENSSPTISNNEISDVSEYGIYAKFGDSLRIINNTMINAEMLFLGSIIKELWLKGTSITKINTTVENSHLDETSILEVQWSLHIRVVDENGNPVEGAAVFVYDVYDSMVSTQITDSDGWTGLISIVEYLQSSSSTEVHNPYRVMVVKDDLTSTSMVTVEEDTNMVVSLEIEEAITPPSKSVFPWAIILIVAFIGAIGISGLCIEVMKYGLLTLFLPLYTRIRKEKLLDQPTRERIYGYIIGNPGAYFGLIKEELDLGNGQLVYHLKQLEDAHLIYSREDGAKKRFYPSDIPRAKSGTPLFSDIQEKILTIIKNNSGIGQKKIANKMGISRQVASYHLTKMERKGLIDKEVIGRESRYYPSREYNV